VKLGVLYEPASANGYYRATIPMGALERRSHEVVWPAKVEEVPMRKLSGCDLVHCYRRMDLLGDLRRLSERGVAISFDNDDDYAAAEVSDGGRGLEGHRYNKELFRDIIKAARLADLTTTPSAPLAERYRAAGVENVAVIENHLGRDMFGFGSKSKHEGVVVGWVAGREHRLDLERVPIADALKRLLDIHPELRVLSVGVRLPLHSERYEHILEVPFHDLLKITGRIDIGIAPLADTAFNRSRSNVKLKEYASGGAMWLASPVEPYRGLGERQGGLLVADDDWFVMIDGLIRNSRRRGRLAKRALKWAKAQTIDRHVAAWEGELHGAVERAQRRVGSAQPLIAAR
jgi:hypothetical protein